MEPASSPKVSIIMPTYNRADFIEQTIQSIVQQTYSNWELIIMDDGSDDNTEEIVQHIGDERIHFYKAGRIGINGKIKNIGLQKALGGLIAFIDSDDLWAPTKLVKQVATLQQFPEAGFCLSGGYNFKIPNEPFEFFYKNQEGLKYDDLFLSFFQSELPGFTQALLFRKKCLQKTGYFKEVKSFSDVDFIVALAYHFKGVILYEPLVFRRLHPAGYSHSTWIKNYGEGAQIIKNYKDKIPSWVYRKALFKLYINFGESCLKHKKRGKAITQFLKAWRYKPFNIVPLKKTAKAVLHFLRNK